MDAVKFSDVTETTVSGLAAPYGGPFSGRDLDGEFFTKSTDFALDWYAEIPLLYHHGRDGVMQTTKVGSVKSRELTDDGVWAEAQLDASNKYFEVIKKLIKAGKLFFSSAAPPHLVQTDTKSGEIRRWPMYELSLTPTPSNLLATTSTKAEDLVIVGEHGPDLFTPTLPAENQQTLRATMASLNADFDAILAR
jgi:hypothetical protein